MPGDRIVSIDGSACEAFGALRGTRGRGRDARSAPARPLPSASIHADGSTGTITVTLPPPSQIDVAHGALGIAGRTRGRPVNTSSARSSRRRRSAVDRTGQALTLIWNGLGQLADSIVSHPTEAPPVAGPIGIASQVGDVFWQLGPVFTLYLAGILSANLALVNILPFPPLDGGRIAVLLLKEVAGERVSLRAERLTYLVGFACLMGFLAWITYFDITAPGRGQ